VQNARDGIGLHQSNRTGRLMADPALAPIAGFIIPHFFLAVGLSFTNQHLVPPNSVEFTRFTNCRQLLGMGILYLGPEKDATGAVVLDDQRQPKLLELRRSPARTPITRNMTGCANGSRGRRATGASMSWRVTWCS
jgi:ABC-type sugar transport system permease subunit